MVKLLLAVCAWLMVVRHAVATPFPPTQQGEPVHTPPLVHEDRIRNDFKGAVELGRTATNIYEEKENIGRALQADNSENWKRVKRYNQNINIFHVLPSQLFVQYPRGNFARNNRPTVNAIRQAIRELNVLPSYIVDHLRIRFLFDTRVEVVASNLRYEYNDYEGSRHINIYRQ